VVIVVVDAGLVMLWDLCGWLWKRVERVEGGVMREESGFAEG